jgi:predicted nucleotidyltransferase
VQSVIQKKSYNSVKIFWLNKEILNQKINSAVKKIISNCKEVEEIVLFGSLSKNRATVSSDVDILIVVNSSSERFIDRPLKYKDFFENIGLDLDIFVYTDEELKRNITLVENAFKEGKILFKKT